MPTRACTVGLRPKPTCSNIFVSARRRFTKWCSRLNAQASLQDSRAFPAASKCSLIRKTCRPYVDTEFIRSKSLRRGTSGRRTGFSSTSERRGYHTLTLERGEGDMPRLMQAIAAAAMVSFCASCATVTRGTTEQIQIVSDPPGAEARTSMGFVCVTPCTLQVGRKDEFTVTVSKPGYQPAEVPVSTKVNPGG